jgi:hypothetical protein
LKPCTALQSNHLQIHKQEDIDTREREREIERDERETKSFACPCSISEGPGHEEGITHILVGKSSVVTHSIVTILRNAVDVHHDVLLHHQDREDKERDGGRETVKVRLLLSAMRLYRVIPGDKNHGV